MATCKIVGQVFTSRGEPLDGSRIYATPQEAPVVVTTSTGTQIVTCNPIGVLSQLDGTFELDLLRNVTFTIVIKEAGLVGTILVPDQVTANLFTLLGTQPIVTSTGTQDSQSDNW